MPFLINIPRDWIIEAEAWQWAAAIGMSGAIALGLYGWNSAIKRRSTGQGLPAWGRWAMGLMRFCALSIIGFLLLEPLIKSVTYDEENPLAILLFDESASVMARNDAATADTLNGWAAALVRDLGNRGLDVERYGFSSEMRAIVEADSAFQWDGAQTNLNAAIRSLAPRIENRNIAGIVLASDGLINRGASPVYGVEWPNLPVWTVGLGDTTAVRDRWINTVNHNAIAYLGNAFPVQAVVESQGMDGQTGQLEVLHNGSVIASESWQTTGTSERTKLEFMLTAEATGLQKYTLRVTPTTGEYDKNNNQRTLYIDVLESRRVIACIGAAAHPDLGAIRMALEALESYEILVFDVASLRNPITLTDALNEADVVIAHNLFGKRWGGMEWTKLLATNDLPVWWMAADETTWDALQSDNDLGVQMTASGDLTQTHAARLNPAFAALEWPDGLAEALREWPPFFGPFEQVTWSPAWSTVAFRQFGDVETNDAFWGMRGASSGSKQILSIGEGLWRWRMRNFALNQSHAQFDTFIQRQVQFLAAEDARKRLVVQTEKRIGADQRVQFSGQAFDAAWTPMRDATIELKLTDEAGQVFTRTMLPAARGFEADFGRMPAGTYRWEAMTTLDGTAFEDAGMVIIEDSQIERTHAAADLDVLAQVSDITGGAFLGYWKDTAPEAAGTAMATAGIPATLRHEQTQLRDAIDWRFWLALALALLTVEWIVRRRNLGY
ncbi:MAG: hypothetical protein ACPG08_03740 [Flavobacteriales bacterium]